MGIIQNTLEQGLIYAIMALGGIEKRRVKKHA